MFFEFFHTLSPGKNCNFQLDWSVRLNSDLIKIFRYWCYQWPKIKLKNAKLQKLLFKKIIIKHLFYLLNFFYNIFLLVEIFWHVFQTVTQVSTQYTNLKNKNQDNKKKKVYNFIVWKLLAQSSWGPTQLHQNLCILLYCKSNIYLSRRYTKLSYDKLQIHGKNYIKIHFFK